MLKCPPDAVKVKAEGRAVRSLHERGLTWVSFKPMPDVECGIDFAIRNLPSLGLLSGAVRGVRHVHKRRDSGDGNDDFSLHINLSGISMVESGRGDATLRNGDAMLLSYSASRTVSRPGLVDHHILRLPRTALSPLVRDIDNFVLRPILRDTGALRLLTNYVGAVFGDPAFDKPAMRHLVGAPICDLVAVTLGATRDASVVADGRGMRAARLQAIKADIEAHLADGRLSPVAVARRLAISDSYIRKLFGSEGTSFSDFVLARRLVRAHRLLVDPLRTARSIAEIAFEVGFGDLSYFNKTFRRRFGATPSDIREISSRSRL
jgi:AraC-like DNA-binding protein